MDIYGMTMAEQTIVLSIVITLREYWTKFSKIDLHLQLNISSDFLSKDWHKT